MSGKEYYKAGLSSEEGPANNDKGIRMICYVLFVFYWTSKYKMNDK